MYYIIFSRLLNGFTEKMLINNSYKLLRVKDTLTIGLKFTVKKMYRYYIFYKHKYKDKNKYY
jgi:hypothetical protein